jgi:hypothetical protein
MRSGIVRGVGGAAARQTKTQYWSADRLADMSVAVSLDHVGLAGRDLSRLAAAYENLGFTLTPLARQSGRRSPAGPVERFGTGNRCAMLRHGYIELLGIADPALFAHGLDGFLTRYEGIHIVALGMEDEQANLHRLRRAGIAVSGVSYLERPVDDADPAGPTARFARLPLQDAPEGRVQLVRHLTPEVIWQDRFLHHPNAAIGLQEVVLAVADPAETASRFSRLAGRPVLPDPAGGFVLELARGRVRMVPEATLSTVLPGLSAPCLPFIAGIVVATADGNRAISALLAERHLPHRAMQRGVLVAPEAAGGAAVLFVPDMAAQ